MKKTTIIYVITAAVLLAGAFGIFGARFDLTAEKRYTLASPTVQILKSIEKPVKIDVYLEGDFPASFRQVQNETKFLLEQFRKINPNIQYRFIDPIATKMSKDTLMAMGMQPSVLPDMKDGKISEIILFPYASVRHQNQGTTVPLIVSQTGIDADTQLARSIEALEYNFIAALKTLTQQRKKNIGILINQDELRPDEFAGFMDMALENYNAGPIIPENQTELSYGDMARLSQMDALVIAKPRKAFTENEKVLLDQYIMNGGKTMWMIDAVNAEMDSLFRSTKIMAYPIDLNLTDFFFNYGLRLNSGLVKDVKRSAMIRLVSGEVAGNPQYSSFMWPYFPLGIAENTNPVTKNINPVKFEFPTSIDTLSRPGLKTQVLFQSSEQTMVKQVPNYVALSEIIQTDSLGQSEKPSVPKIFAVSVSGKFRSAYATRSESKIYPKFKAENPENKMIVIADGDIARNQIYKGNALPLGEDLLTKQTYGNEQFLRNALDYLLDDANLMELRNRNITARLLDRTRIDEEKNFWQYINLLCPLIFFTGAGFLFSTWRRRRFGKK